jgi:catechol 2,3-dioxygenase-like lactoylglutathione lyase family enzyme
MPAVGGARIVPPPYPDIRHLAHRRFAGSGFCRRVGGWQRAQQGTYDPGMTILHMDHVSVVVEDLQAAIAFFVELGMELEGEARIEGPWVDRINALDGIQVDIAMMRTPDGHGRLELTRFHAPPVISPEPSDALGNTLGLRSVMFAVDDIDSSVAGLLAHGGALIGDVVTYEDQYRLCYVRGPAGIIVSLAEPLS